MITDMTEGNPSQILWRFSLPLLVSVIFQQLYNIVDSVVAGQFIGPDALAAVGASYPITMLFMAVATGCNIGCSVVVSQLFGAHDFERMKTGINTSVLSVFGLSIVLTGAGLLSCRSLMALLGTPQNIFADAGIYLNIYIAGLVFLFLYNICTGIFTALGDSRTPLYFLIASSVGNIVLDILFVTAFHMGVAGVAWATFLAQGVSSVLAFFALLRRLRTVPHAGKPRLFSLSMLGRISAIAIPSILQQSFISIGNLFIQRIVNGYGSTIIAGFSGAIKLNTFALTCCATFANGLSSFAAQNIGAGRLDRVKSGMRAGAVMAVILALPFTLLFVFGGGAAMRLFVGASGTDVVAAGAVFLRIVAPFYVVIALKLMADSVLRGAGDMVAFMIATFADLLLRVTLAWTLAARGAEASGIWFSWPAGWTIAAVLSMGFYLTGGWKRKCPQ
ncbi:MAG: MATE family efflux transporter [Intestinibacillus sp.]